ncbi:MULTISPECIES: GtrA family protein [unclassified Streptomyces]|uniref:GtrA family protein n=1 Tax=unclassified Streptomyces TaxID=2593676 RepID=UPI003FD3E0A0
MSERRTLRSRLEQLKQLARELAKFGTVGAVGFLVNFVVFNLCVHAVGLAVVRSGVIATFIAICTNYVGNRYWTYRDCDKSRRSRELTLFFLFSGVGLVIENGILALSHYGFGFTSTVADNIAKNVIGLGIATVFRFWSYRTWVFRALPGRKAVETAESFLEENTLNRTK